MSTIASSETKENLVATNRELFEHFDLADCIQQFDAIDEEKPYNFVSPWILNLWERIQGTYGASGFEAFQKATMLTFIEQAPQRRANMTLSDTVLQCYEESFARVSQSIDDPEFESYRTNNDVLLKDLALCRLKLFPVGAQVVEPNSNFHRALLYRRGIGQAWRLARLIANTGGNRGWYQIHTHLSELTHFNPEGWDRCYLRIAQMLRLHPNCKGMWGASWFYDPALDDISPKLAYLRSPLAAGAQLFYSHPDLHGGALARSKTRQQLHADGKYDPSAFALIWPREPMLRWASDVEA